VIIPPITAGKSTDRATIAVVTILTTAFMPSKGLIRAWTYFLFVCYSIPGEAPLVRLSQAQVHPRVGVGAQSGLVVTPRGGVSPGEAVAALGCAGARAGQ